MSQNVVRYEVYDEAEERVEHEGHNRSECVRLLLKCDGTRAETRFLLSSKRTSPFKSARASVQSTAGSRGVRISGSNAGYTVFQRWCEGYCVPTPFGSFPFTSPPVRHRVPSRFDRTLHQSANTWQHWPTYALLHVVHASA